jgi:addiction module HigA family antidote
MPAKTQTPSAVLVQFMDEYQLNPFSMSKVLQLHYQSVRRLVSGQAKITAPIAFKLAQLFGNKPDFWTALQMESDLKAVSDDKEFMAVVKSIQKAKKPTAAKPVPAKSKKAAKAPAKGKRKK